MKTGWWILIGIVIFIILFLAVDQIMIRLPTPGCSTFNPEKCDKTCTIDEDCRSACGCGCINTEEECKTGKRGLISGISMMPQCIQAECKCIAENCKYIGGPLQE